LLEILPRNDTGIFIYNTTETHTLFGQEREIIENCTDILVLAFFSSFYHGWPMRSYMVERRCHLYAGERLSTMESL
jgi:hypothetical protein